MVTETENIKKCQDKVKHNNVFFTIRAKITIDGEKDIVFKTLSRIF